MAYCDRFEIENDEREDLIYVINKLDIYELDKTFTKMKSKSGKK